MKYYILDGNKEVQECSSEEAWKSRKSINHRIVGRTQIGDVRVSTVFLTFDHSFDDGPPVLFETMIFGGDHDEYQERYHTYKEACEGHLKAIDMVRGVLQS